MSVRPDNNVCVANVIYNSRNYKCLLDMKIELKSTSNLQ